jgi:hypothetical protein
MKGWIKYIVTILWLQWINMSLFYAQNYSTIENFNHTNSLSTSAVMYNGRLYINGWMVDSISPYRNLNLFAEIDTSTGNRISYKKFSLATWDLNFDETCFLKLPDGRFVSGGAINLGARCLILFYDSLGVVTDTIPIQDSTSIHFYPKNLLYKDSSLYFLVGRTESDFDGNLWLVKIDLNGNIVWTQTYGVSNLTELAGSLLDLDTCILVGSARSTLNHVPNSIEDDSHTWLFTIDTAGNILNEWLDPDGRTYWPDRMLKTANGNIIMAGGYRGNYVWSDHYEVWWNGYVASFNLNSWSKDWWKQHGNLTNLTYFHDIDSVNGGYLLTGADAIDTPVVSSDPSGWLMKVDLNGDKIWETKYLPFAPGTIYECKLRETLFLPSGDMISVGWADNGQYHGWILRTDSTGCLAPNCAYIGINEPLPNNYSIKVYPNPAQTNLIFSYQSESQEPLQLDIFDMLGRMMYSKEIQTGNTPLNIETWPKGVYVYRLNSKGILIKAGKLIVE